MANYENLSKKLQEQIENDINSGALPNFSFNEDNVVRRYNNSHDSASVWRTAFIRDIDKILNCPFYNRYADKTQVFSLYKNDDITHRSLHVQLVSRIARTIGKTLGLNLDLIEAISLGHDIGHTPFGHSGERVLDNLYREKTGRRFFHNIHSVRVLDKIFTLNLSLQTLDGIACHNGELELEEYRPAPLNGFTEFDYNIEKCYIDGNHVLKLVPSTLEGCVMRISDIIAYLGKDRHDAEKSKLYNIEPFSDNGIGVINAEIANNLIVNIIENSYGKPYIKMDNKHFNALMQAKKDNYQKIYNAPEQAKTDSIVKEMAAKIYEKLLFDLDNSITSSPIFTHHIEYLNKPYYRKNQPYLDTEKNQIVVDYIASMTDDYLIELFHYLFPKSSLKLEYFGYFE